MMSSGRTGGVSGCWRRAAWALGERQGLAGCKLAHADADADGRNVLLLGGSGT